MVSTRSGNKQTHLEDFTENKAASKRPSKTKGATKQEAKSSTSEDRSSPSRKRKTPPADKKSPTKKSKTEVKTEDEQGSKSTKDEPIVINRAPVLHLWGACVTHFLYPKLEWSTCLSAGNAISSICAVTKGRAIGAIDPPEDTHQEKRKKKDEASELDELEVMHFKLKQKDGKSVFSGKSQGDDDAGLRKKYGERYEEVKGVFDKALASWKGSEDELSRAGFGMYEDFRPDVSKGQKGWGRKGALDLEIVRKTVAKE